MTRADLGNVFDEPDLALVDDLPPKCAECGKPVPELAGAKADVYFCGNCPHPIHDGDYSRDRNGKLVYKPKTGQGELGI